MSNDLHIGMMGDGTEEQNLGQVGDPSARITQSEVEQAFAARAPAEPRVFAQAAATAKSAAAAAKDAVDDKTEEAQAIVRRVRGKVKDRAEDAQAAVDTARAAAEDAATDAWSGLKDRATAVREHLEQSAESVRAWAAEQGRVAKQTAADKPVLVVSASAGTALAVGLAVGVLLGRATADD
jgi:hypothetical protein